MNVRARCACWLIVLATGCSDGTEPAIPPGGLFTAGLTGARNLQLTGSAFAGVIFVETGIEYIVRMVEAGSGQPRLVAIVCQGEAVPEVGTHPLGPEEECLGRYVRSPGLPTTELAESATGSFTVTTQTDQELSGRFRFSGDLVVGADSVGSLTVTGTFRAVPQP
jgi:hypothetical protein